MLIVCAVTILAVAFGTLLQFLVCLAKRQVFLGGEERAPILDCMFYV